MSLGPKKHNDPHAGMKLMSVSRHNPASNSLTMASRSSAARAEGSREASARAVRSQPRETAKSVSVATARRTMMSRHEAVEDVRHKMGKSPDIPPIRGGNINVFEVTPTFVSEFWSKMKKETDDFKRNRTVAVKQMSATAPPAPQTVDKLQLSARGRSATITVPDRYGRSPRQSISPNRSSAVPTTPNQCGFRTGPARSKSPTVRTFTGRSASQNELNQATSKPATTTFKQPPTAPKRVPSLSNRSLTPQPVSRQPLKKVVLGTAGPKKATSGTTTPRRAPVSKPVQVAKPVSLGVPKASKKVNNHTEPVKGALANGKAEGSSRSTTPKRVTIVA